MGKRWMRLAALTASLGLAVSLAGCSQADAVKAASMIHAYVPTVIALAQDAVAMAGALDPADAGTMQAVSAKVQADLQTLGQVSGAYAGAPSSDGWASLGTAVDTLVADADQGLLAAVAIKNPESQLRAKAALSALDAAVHVVDGYLLQARTPAEAQAAAAERSVKVQSVVRYWRPQDWQRVEEASSARGEELLAWETRQGF
jgi:hypothetical protein